MKVNRFCSIIFIFTLFIHTSLALGQNDETRVIISKIRINGAKSISKGEIKEKIGIQFPSIKPWVKDPEFDEEILRDDMVRIKRLYANHGYYDAKSEYKLKYNQAKDRVEITINIDEGKPVVLTELNINLEGELSEEVKKTIVDAVPLKVNKPFSPIKYQETKGLISSTLSEIGYPKPVVEGEALVNRKEKWAKVNFNVDTGPLYKFGSTQVQGNEEVEAYVITREATFKEGDIYSTKKLNETRARIFQLDLFSSVLTDVNFDENEKIADIVIKVREKKLGTVKVGLGYGTEDQFRGQVIWTQRNFFGGGRRVELAGRFSFLTQIAEAKFTQPYIIGGSSELFGIFSLFRDDFPSFTSRNAIGTGGVKKRFAEVYNAYGSFSVQHAKLSDISNAVDEFIEGEDFLLTFFSFSLERNTTDSIFNPTKGTIATIGLESSFEALGSDVNYLLGTVDLKGYREFFNKVVLAKRLTLGVIQPFGDTDTLGIPIFKRFFAGGSTTMRGFPFQKLGPLASNEDPIGGNSLLLGSFELRFPLYKDFGGVLFLDYGNVYSQEFDFKLDEIKYAIGTGLRYNTLIGPIRLDFGYALNPEPGIGRFQFFLSIGQAF